MFEDEETDKKTQVEYLQSVPAVQSAKENIKTRSTIFAAFIAGVLGGIFAVSLMSDFSAQDGGILNNIERTVVDEESAVINVVERTEPAIVSVVGTKKVASLRQPGDLDDFFFFFPFSLTPRPTQDSEEEQKVSAGTGFFVRSDGLLATNKHVIADNTASYKVLTNDGKEYAAQVVARDPVNDIALLKVEGNNFPVLELGNSDDIKVGQKVIAIGNALGQFSNTVTTGVVSGINRSIVASGETSGPSQIDGAIQTDAAINPGNSGGPLLDLSGRVLGINTAISLEGQLLGFAIPSNDLKKDIEVYTERKTIVKPYIGVHYIMISEGLRLERNLTVKQGALIAASSPDEPAVVPGSPANQAGLREGDVILKVAGEEVNLNHSLAAALRNLNPGQTVELLIYRDGEEIKINITLGERED